MDGQCDFNMKRRRQLCHWTWEGTCPLSLSLSQPKINSFAFLFWSLPFIGHWWCWEYWRTLCKASVTTALHPYVASSAARAGRLPILRGCPITPAPYWRPFFLPVCVCWLTWTCMCLYPCLCLFCLYKCVFVLFVCWCVLYVCFYSW